jgi:hypothetical protein
MGSVEDLDVEDLGLEGGLGVCSWIADDGLGDETAGCDAHFWFVVETNEAKDGAGKVTMAVISFAGLATYQSVHYADG